MMNQNSLRSAREKFVPERSYSSVRLCPPSLDRKSLTHDGSGCVAVAHHLPNVPFMLVGTKEDLMNDEETLKLMKEKGRAAVTEDELRAAANEFGAFAAMICSSRSLHNVRQVFEAAIQRSAFTVK
jgi:GTPase SAR1 family protein